MTEAPHSIDVVRLTWTWPVPNRNTIWARIRMAEAFSAKRIATNTSEESEADQETDHLHHTDIVVADKLHGIRAMRCPVLFATRSNRLSHRRHCYLMECKIGECEISWMIIILLSNFSQTKGQNNLKRLIVHQIFQMYTDFTIKPHLL